ncbi:TIGR04222 domain-containing membrane protein [Nonomuraea sp. NPDC050783]|uniref:TIGR04222 domain-containing membrane protein n=1 Tax=Nonomuraea sp. NPDC050783 TaxID=3154634 RepID=UPI0034666C79
MDLFLLIAAVAMAVFVLRTGLQIRRELAAVMETSAATRPQELGHYELAWLAGGAYRVAETAVTVLAGAGALRMTRGGKVCRVHDGTAAREPVEESVLGILASSSGLSVGTLCAETTRTLSMSALARRLVDLGLVHSPGVLAWARRLVTRFRWTLLAAFAGEVAAVVTMVVRGVSAYALLAMAVLGGAGALALVMILKGEPDLRVPLTQAGKETLDAARARHPQGRAEEPVAVALYGRGEIRDGDLQVELARSASNRGNRPGATWAPDYLVPLSWGDGGDGGDGGSGCGAGCGGSCGGGCGGCGGGI